jgi:hypothetical protein
MNLLANPWVLPGVVLTLIGTHTAVGLWQRHDGAASVKAAYEARDAESARASAAKILALEEANRKTENEHAEMLAAIGEAHEKDRAAQDARRVRDVADARSGALKLRDPGAKPAACPGAVSGAATSPGGSDGPAAGELSHELAEFLVSEADRADAIVADLASCQAVVRADRAQTKE